MGERIITALDLGSTFGFAVGKDGVIVRSGELALSAHDSHPGHRWLRFREWLINNCADSAEILYENVTGFRSSDAAKVYGALLSQLECYALQYEKRLSCLTPGQIKGDFTGNGNAKKEIMCDVAMNLGWKHGVRGTRENNNECDACALLWVVYTRRLIQPSFLI